MQQQQQLSRLMKKERKMPCIGRSGPLQLKITSLNCLCENLVEIYVDFHIHQAYGLSCYRMAIITSRRIEAYT